MIFYGVKTLTGLPCEKCDKDTIVLTNHYASGHIFWIPVFGVVIKTLAVCPGCNRTMTLKQLNKKYHLGLTDGQMRDIRFELDGQLNAEKRKIVNRRNTLGKLSWYIVLALFILLVIFSFLF